MYPNITFGRLEPFSTIDMIQASVSFFNNAGQRSKENISKSNLILL